MYFNCGQLWGNVGTTLQWFEVRFGPMVGTSCWVFLPDVGPLYNLCVNECAWCQQPTSIWYQGTYLWWVSHL